MSTAGKLQRSFAPTQLLGAAIQASLWTLSVAQGPFYLARLAGFGGMSGSLATIVAVTILSWLYLSSSFCRVRRRFQFSDCRAGRNSSVSSPTRRFRPAIKSRQQSRTGSVSC